MDNFDWSEVSLENLAGGAAIERFNDALSEVLENIIDPNTDAETIREIKLTLKVKPAKNDRRTVAYALSVIPKLAPASSIGSLMYLSNNTGKVIAMEQNCQQGDLFIVENESKIKKIGGSE